MKKTKFTESQIIGVLKEQEQGKKVVDICREHGISQPTFYQWKSKFSGLDVQHLKKLKQFAAFLTIILLTSCNNGQTSNATASGDDISTLKDLTNKWNECNVRQDMQTLVTLYAEQVSLYGTSISKAQVLSNKEAFFKKHSDFNQSITGEITITKITDSQFKSVFPKRSSFSGKTSDVQGYLLFDKVDGNWKITNESDELTDKNVTKPTKEKITGASIGKSIVGDFDGDDEGEKATTEIVKEGKFDEEAFQLSVNFSSDNVKRLKVSCDQNWIYLINEGDLNGVAGDELTIYSPPNHGCTYTMTTYTFVNGTWQELMEPFMIMTGCDEISDEDLQNRIFLDGNCVYFLEADLNNENFKLVKTKAKLK